jgi:ribonuclease HI
MNNISHITQMLKDKAGLESRWKKIQFYWIPGHCGVEVNERVRKLTQKQINLSKKAEVVNYYQWQILKPSGKRKAKRSFTVSTRTPKRTEERSTLKGTTGMARLPGSLR